MLSGGKKKRAPADCSEVGKDGGVVAGLRYLEFVTKGADPSQPLPMLLVFHSRGGRPEGFTGWRYSVKSPARIILPAGPYRLGSYRTWFDLPAKTSKQDELSEQMQATGDITAEFIRQIAQCRPTLGKPMAVGTSQGGSMTLLMTNQYPHLVGGGVAVAGWLTDDLWRSSMRPTYVLHGEYDTTVPFERTKQKALEMKSRGAEIAFQQFATAHKDGDGMHKQMRKHVNHLLNFVDS